MTTYPITIISFKDRSNITSRFRRERGDYLWQKQKKNSTYKKCDTGQRVGGQEMPKSAWRTIRTLPYLASKQCLCCFSSFLIGLRILFSDRKHSVEKFSYVVEINIKNKAASNYYVRAFFDFYTTAPNLVRIFVWDKNNFVWAVRNRNPPPPFLEALT